MNISNVIRYGDSQKPFYVEYNRREGHFSMPMNHLHSHFELYYLFSGERFYFIEERSYPIKAGDLVLIPCDMLHKTSDTGVPNHERLILYFNESFFRQFGPEEAELLLSPFRGSRRVLQLNAADKLQIEQLLYRLLLNIQERRPGYDITVRHAVTEALLFAARHMLGSDMQAYEEAPSPIESKIIEITQFINAHFREPIPLSALSRAFYLSPSYLSRTFKKITGFGVTGYIGITRVKEAQRLLRETDKRITDISEEAGFGSFAHFEKVFKSLVCQSPKSYRERFRDELQK